MIFTGSAALNRPAQIDWFADDAHFGGHVFQGFEIDGELVADQ